MFYNPEYRPVETIDIKLIQDKVNDTISKWTKNPVTDARSLLKEELGLNDHQLRDICMSLQCHFDERIGSVLTSELKHNRLDTPQSMATAIASRLENNRNYSMRSYQSMPSYPGFSSFS